MKDMTIFLGCVDIFELQCYIVKYRRSVIWI